MDPAWSAVIVTKAPTPETSSVTLVPEKPSPCARLTSGGSRTAASLSIGMSSTLSTSSSRSAPYHHRNNRLNPAIFEDPQSDDARRGSLITRKVNQNSSTFHFNTELFNSAFMLIFPSAGQMGVELASGIRIVDSHLECRRHQSHGR